MLWFVRLKTLQAFLRSSEVFVCIYVCLLVAHEFLCAFGLSKKSSSRDHIFSTSLGLLKQIRLGCHFMLSKVFWLFRVV